MNMCPDFGTQSLPIRGSLENLPLCQDCFQEKQKPKHRTGNLAMPARVVSLCHVASRGLDLMNQLHLCEIFDWGREGTLSNELSGQGSGSLQRNRWHRSQGWPLTGCVWPLPVSYTVGSLKCVPGWHRSWLLSF